MDSPDFEQDDQNEPDPLKIVGRAMNPDRAEDDNSGGGWGRLFSRVAGGPRIKPPTAPTGTPPMAAARALNDFSEASGSPATIGPPDPESSPPVPGSLMTGIASAPPPQEYRSHLDRQGPPPAVPQMDPQYSASQADLRKNATPIPKVDPATGQTADKYKIGPGGRIARALGDFGMGIARGRGVMGATGNVLEGAFGDRNKPGYYGKGAVNGQYAQDERARQGTAVADQARIASFEDEQKQKQTQYEDQRKNYEDSLRQAFQQDTTEIKDRAETEKEKQDKNITDLKQQAQDLREQIRDNPQTVEKGVMQEIQKGDTVYDDKGNLVKAGPATRTWLKERRNQPIVNIRNGGKGDNPELNGMSAAEQREYADRTKTTDRKIDTVTKAQVFQLSFNKDTSALDKQLEDLQKQKDSIRDEIISGRGKGSKAQSAADRIRARKAGPPPTGKPAPVAPKAAPASPVPAKSANNPDGVINPSTKAPFKYVIRNKQTNERRGSDDGQNWSNIQ